MRGYVSNQPPKSICIINLIFQDYVCINVQPSSPPVQLIPKSSYVKNQLESIYALQDSLIYLLALSSVRLEVAKH